MKEITRNPLCWPDQVPRTAPHLRGWPKFLERTLASASDFVCSEINRLNERFWSVRDQSVIISTNLRLKLDGLPLSGQPEPADSGVAVYFQLRFARNGKWLERPIVMTCDKWVKTCNNLYAIGKDIEAQRARMRWGCSNYEQSFRGYLAIPERCGGPSWWEVLQIPSGAGRNAIIAAFKNLSKQYHPDRGGSEYKFLQVREAYEQAMAQFR